MSDERFAELSKRLEDIQVAIAEIRVIYESQAKRLGRVEDVIFGNSRAGLATQVRAVLWIASGSLGFLALIVANIISAWLR